MYACMYVHTYSKSMDQPGKVAKPARGQLNREKEHFPVRIRAPEKLVSRDGFGSRQHAHLHPPEFRGGVHLFIYYMEYQYK